MYSIGVLEREERKQRGSPRKGRQNSSSFSPLSYIIQKAIYHVSCFLNFKRLLPVRPKEGRVYVDCGRGGCRGGQTGFAPPCGAKEIVRPQGAARVRAAPFPCKKRGGVFVLPAPSRRRPALRRVGSVRPAAHLPEPFRRPPSRRPSCPAVRAVPPPELSRRPSRSAARAVPPPEPSRRAGGGRNYAGFSV